MKWVQMQNSKIPAIALGTWSWGSGLNGGNHVFGNGYREEELKPVFQKALQHGFTLWDTAAVYGMGASESIIGQLIKDEHDIILSTKFTPLGFQTRGAMRRSLNKSLGRLGLDHADLYWIHNPKSVRKWTNELIPLMKSGKVRHAGVSNHNLQEATKAAALLESEGLQLSAVQNHYSLLNRTSEEAGILQWCRQRGIVFFSYMVLEQGALTGAYSATHPFQSGTRRGKAYPPDVLKKLETLTAVLNRIGASHGAGPAQVATAWALSKGTVPIIGVTKESHIDGASFALQLELSQSDIADMEKAARDTGLELRGSWEKSMRSS
ncbi:aldo/keto reductase [Gorillibacterium massiliense]|uniref:aldo/keto reductase n=1 Tax=Gorillibacterium massiliense TaxID=1280390 RepID=UPI0004AE8B9D|nr:aldo/keto reductase [Gorillibacterium massiliense]